MSFCGIVAFSSNRNENICSENPHRSLYKGNFLRVNIKIFWYRRVFQINKTPLLALQKDFSGIVAFSNSRKGNIDSTKPPLLYVQKFTKNRMLSFSILPFSGSRNGNTYLKIFISCCINISLKDNNKNCWYRPVFLWYRCVFQ